MRWVCNGCAGVNGMHHPECAVLYATIQKRKREEQKESHRRSWQTRRERYGPTGTRKVK